MIRVLGYMTGILITGWLALLYPKEAVVLLFAAELFLFFPALAAALYLKYSVTAAVEVPIPAAQKGETAEVAVRIRNRAFLPLICGSVRLEIEETFGGRKKTEFDIKIQAGMRSDASWIFRMDCARCGNFKVRVQRLMVGDLLGLLRFRARGEREGETVTVLPRIEPMELEPVQELGNDLGAEETGEYCPFRGGDDPSEVYQIRGYRQGDSLRQIHWKMTARTGELMVKEFSEPVRCAVAVFLDLTVQKGKQKRSLDDEYLEKALSVCAGLLELSCPHDVIWYDRREAALQKIRVDSEEKLYVLIDGLFRAEACDQPIDLEEQCRLLDPQYRWLHSYWLRMNLELWEGGACGCAENRKKML